MDRTVYGFVLLIVLNVCFLSSEPVFAQLMPFLFPCMYSQTTDDGRGEEGEVALSVSIHGNPSYYVPGQHYQVTLSSSSAFNQVQVIGLLESTTSQLGPQMPLMMPGMGVFGQPTSMCTVVHQYYSIFPDRRSIFMWRAPQEGTGCVSFMVTAVSNQDLLFKDLMALQLCEAGAPTPSPHRPQLAMIHNEEVILRDDFDSSTEIDYTIWSEIYGGNISDTCGSVLHGNAAVFCGPFGQRELNTVQLNTTTASALQFAISSGSCRPGKNDYSVTVSYAVNNRVDWHIIDKMRPPSDGGTSVHIVHLPLAARTEAVSLRFHQDLAMDAHSYSGCWALDNVLVTNMAHRPTSLQETFDPIDPTSWLFFPNGAIREKCQSSGNALYFHGDGDSEDDDYQFVTTQDLNLWKEEHSSNPALLQEFESMTHLTNWEVRGAELSTMCDRVFASNSLVMNGAGERTVCTPYINTTTIGNLRFYYVMGGGSCDPADTENVEVSVFAQVSGQESLPLYQLHHDSYKKPQLVSIVVPPQAQAPSTKFCLSQPTHKGVNRNVWAIDNLHLLPDVAPNPTAHLQFGMNLRCGKEANDTEIRVEFSTDMGRTWWLVRERCLPGSCQGVMTPDSSVYQTGDFAGRWDRVTIPLPTAALTKQTRFRWSQTIMDPAHTMWALDNVYIGDACGTTMCNGHGKCTREKCRCDQGYSGDACLVTVKDRPTNLTENFDNFTLEFGQNDKFSVVRGASPGYGCGMLASGKALVFNGAKRRELITTEINMTDIKYLEFTVRIGSHGSAGSCSPAKDESQSVVVMASCDNGIHWHLIKHLQFDAYKEPRTILVHLTPAVQRESCLVRWWQPSNGGENRGVWALDDVSLTASLRNNINLNFTDHREVRRALTFHTGQIGEACNISPALVLPGASHPSGASILETQSLQVGASFMIQFYLAIGCGQQHQRHYQGHDFGIHLEYSTDHGLSWHEVIRSCMPGQVGCTSYQQGSTYHSSEYPTWSRVSLPLPARLRFAVTRFRLRQSHHVAGATWAIRHLYIGEECPDMCHGHGVCQEGICECDAGYIGESCLPETPRLEAIQSNFEEAGQLTDWARIQGGSVSCGGRGCGTISWGCSLYFHGPGVRQLVSRDVSTVEASYVLFYVRIGSEEDKQTCSRGTRRGEGVLLQYSTDSGITWNHLLELYYKDYTTTRFIRKELPTDAQSPATRFRWRQPQHGGSYHSQWALDDIFIGNDFRLQALGTTAVNDDPQQDIWMTISNGQVGSHCRSRGRARYFNADSEDRFAVTRSLALTTGQVIQFKIVVGCQQVFGHFAPVYLEMSSDGGLRWELVTDPCFPFADGDTQCGGPGGQITEGSIYHTGKYSSWRLVVIPVTQSMTHSNVQLRWWQAADPFAPAFGLEDVYIGDACPDHCNGHGVCRNAECECDSGYHGPSCTPKGSNPQSFNDGFDDASQAVTNRQWSSILGAGVGQGCGVIKMDNSLYFNDLGPREAETSPVNTTAIKMVQFYIRIGSADMGDQCRPVSSRAEAVIVQFSNNAGITWHTLKVLDPTQLGQRSTQITITLPLEAKTADTVFRWWQPFLTMSDIGAQWALDNVVIGANETRQDGFQDDFNPAPTNSWYMTMGGAVKPYCGIQTAMVFDTVTEIPRYTETWDFHVTMATFLQFDLIMGCRSAPSSAEYSVLLEYSLDMGRTWALISEGCSPPDVGCGQYSMGTEYLSQLYGEWTRVTVYLPEAVISNSTRFRWKQRDFRPGRDVWAIDNTYLGNGCPWMCSGHGRCNQGHCECDNGYEGSFCVPSIPLPNKLKESFDSSPTIDASRWLQSHGAMLSDRGCGGVLVSGKAAVFNGPRLRMLVSKDLDCTMLEYIQFTFKFGCHSDETSGRSSAVLLQYSINGGISWLLLQELPYTNTPATFFNIKLPMTAKINSTRFRLWQPAHSLQGDAWAVDNLVVGGNLMRMGYPISDSFDKYSMTEDDWMFYPGGTMLSQHCLHRGHQGASYVSNPQDGSYRVGDHPSLVFPRTTIGEHSATTRDIDVNDHTVVQFEINVGCTNQSRASHPVRLEVSRDFGSTWSLLLPDCFSNQSTSLSCSHHVTTPSVYYNGENQKWVRYTIPLYGLHICGTVRFRWYQGHFGVSDTPKQWAIDGIYVGPRCPFNCNGHGSCLDGFTCRCDAGYGGAYCHTVKPNPYFLKETFENRGPLDDRKFFQWSGAEVTQKCGTLITGRSLHFTGAGRRMLTTVDMDLTMASYISFYLRLGCSQHAPSSLNPPIVLQSSTDGGITWDHIEEMTFDPSDHAPKYVALVLPDKTHGNATRIRWWQPSLGGAYIDEWAIDQIYIGGYIHGQMVLEDDFTTSLQNDGDQYFSIHDQYWLISPGGAMDQVCGVAHNSLHFASNELMRYTVTSDVMVTEHTFIQFDIALGCTEPQACYGVLLEFSLDMGRSWRPLLTECFPSQVECTSYHMRSVFLADVYYGWNRVTLPLPHYTKSKSTRFRWSQPPRFDPGHVWALTNVYIGSECSNMCSGHGHCTSGMCSCDAGWKGASCQRPSVHLPQALRDAFTDHPTSGRGHWSKVNGAVTSDLCGPVASGSYLHFRNGCTRQLITKDLDLTQADFIQFYFRFGCLNSSQDRDEGVLLEYSLNGGISWKLLSELYHHQYDTATFVSVALPSKARHNGTRLKWWQPSHSGADTADWGIDNVFVGGSATLPNLLRDSFEDGGTLQDHWLFSDNAELREDVCRWESGHRGTDMQPLSDGDRMSWTGGIDSGESSSLTTQDLMLEKDDVLEFKISIGCNASWDSLIQPVHLLYSVDHGMTWTLVTQQCLTSDPTCDQVVTLPSILHSFAGWRRVIIPLRSQMTGRAIRFRWYQDAAPSASQFQQWALDDVRIGKPCLDRCSGHGSCDYPGCICDSGFHGDSCEMSTGLRTDLKEEVVGTEMSPLDWPLIQGGVIAKGSSDATCGVLREGRSLYFSGNGARLAETVALDLRDARFIQFYVVIGSELNSQECLTPTSRMESVILQYSTDGGISWVLLKELYYLEYRTPQLEYLPLPVGARTHATQVRWWQPLDVARPRAQWALDNIFIGGSEINPSLLTDSFEESSSSSGSQSVMWDFHPYGSTELGVCHQNRATRQNAALYWSNQRNAAYDSAATTRQLIVDKNYMIQFKIVIGCQSAPTCNLTHAVVLEYRTNPSGQAWTVLRPACLPGDEEDARCDPFGYHDDTSYNENQYFDWKTVTVELPLGTVSGSTQFRWIQRDASKLAPSWAVDDVYIGEKCPNMCSGHGQCVAGPRCICEPGYQGESCSPAFPLPNFLRFGVDRGLIPSMDPWSELSGGGEGSGCGRLVPHAHGASLYFNGCGLRQAVTRELDTRGIVEIGFVLQIGSRYPNNTSCRLDLSTPDARSRAVLLQYTLNNGIEWRLIQSHGPRDYDGPTRVSYQLPPEARGLGVRFRWWQPRHGGESWDQWALDNVELVGATKHRRAVGAGKP